MTPSSRYETQAVDTTPLTQALEFKFAGRSASNRFMKAAMQERLCTWKPDDLNLSGVPDAAMFRVYEEWSEGSIGIILTGSIIFEHDQITQRGDPVVPTGTPCNGKRFDAFATLAGIGKTHGSLMIGQINHPGRLIDESMQAHPISASDIQQDIQTGQTFAKPHAASKDEIGGILEGFAHCAAYLEGAGFDGVEIHAAHGYLPAQFLSSTSNLRTDEYGGDLRSRLRLIAEVAQAIRKRTGSSFILGIKLNSVEFQGSFESNNARELCAFIEDNSFDFVELSGGTLEHFQHKRESTRRREAFFLDFAESVAPLLSQTRVYITGGFKTAGAMVQALDKAHGIGLGRPLCQEPQLCRGILEGIVNTAIKQLPSEDNFAVSNVVAGTQIRRISRSHHPLDMSQEYNEDSFNQEMSAWTDRLKSDSNAYGFFDVTPAAFVRGFGCRT